MNLNFPIFSIVLLSPLAVATGCFNSSSNNPKTDANNPTVAELKLNDGEYQLLDASCDPNNPPYGAYGAYGAYGSGAYGSGLPFGQNTKYIINIASDNAFFNEEITNPTTGIVCKYNESLLLVNEKGIVSFKSNGIVTADKANDISCTPVTTSLIDTIALNDEYSFQIDNNIVTLTAKSDKFCSTYGFAGQNVVVTFEKK